MVILNNGISQFDEQRDHVAVEQILQVVFLDPQHSNPVSISSKRRETHYQVWSRLSISLLVWILLLFQALEKLFRQLAVAEAATEVRQKPAEETDPKVVGEGLVIDEWVRQRNCSQYLLQTLLSFAFSDMLWLFFICRKKEGKDT